MRNQMFETVSDVLRKDEKTILFLVDIGVWGFKELLEEFPDRVKNIGIFEDGMISIASGLALGGYIPIIYGITPFILERALEQLKLDFGYQMLGGNFITTGAAYDFSKIGYSHYCPEDLGIIQMLPTFEFIAPGTAHEFDELFRKKYANDKPTCFRLSDYTNEKEHSPSIIDKATVIQRGEEATIIAVSTMVDKVLDACRGEDVTVLYYSTLKPFDRETLEQNCPSGKILVCEPHFEGLLTYEISKAMANRFYKIDYVGLPRAIFRNYGTKEEKDKYYGLTVKNIGEKLRRLINE